MLAPLPTRGEGTLSERSALQAGALQMVSRDLVLEGAAEDASAFGIGVGVRLEMEMRLVAGHDDAGVQPGIPVGAAEGVRGGHGHAHGQGIVADDAHVLELAVGDLGPDVVDAGAAVVAPDMHGGAAGYEVVNDLALVAPETEDRRGARPRILRRPERLDDPHSAVLHERQLDEALASV